MPCPRSPWGFATVPGRQLCRSGRRFGGSGRWLGLACVLYCLGAPGLRDCLFDLGHSRESVWFRRGQFRIFDGKRQRDRYRQRPLGNGCLSGRRRHPRLRLSLRWRVGRAPGFPLDRLVILDLYKGLINGRLEALVRSLLLAHHLGELLDGEAGLLRKAPQVCILRDGRPQLRDELAVVLLWRGRHGCRVRDLIIFTHNLSEGCFLYKLLSHLLVHQRLLRLLLHVSRQLMHPCGQFQIGAKQLGCSRR